MVVGSLGSDSEVQDNKPSGVPEMNQGAMTIGQIELLSKDRALVTSEIHKTNDYYGHGFLLKKFAGIDTAYSTKTAMEHGPGVVDYIWHVDLEHKLPLVLVQSEFRAQLYKARAGDRLKAVSIGPSILYTPDEPTEPKEANSRTLLVFPVHSTHHELVEFDVAHSISVIRERARGFDHVLVCVYWRDVLLGRHRRYLAEGFECTTAGHMFDPEFLPRLRGIVSRATATMSTYPGTSALYSAILGKPVWIAPERDKSLRSIHKNASEVRKVIQQYDDSIARSLQRSFAEPVDCLTAEQLELAREVTGYYHLKTKPEILEIFREAEARYAFVRRTRQNPIPLAGDQNIQDSKMFDAHAPDSGLRWDYVDPLLRRLDLDPAFPDRIDGDLQKLRLPASRPQIPHKVYVDRRRPNLLSLNRDEVHLLYHNARQFSGLRALEIGCSFGWSTAYLVAAQVTLTTIDPLLSEPEVSNSVIASLKAAAQIAGVTWQVRLCPGFSPGKISEVARAQGETWSFFLIDGSHVEPCPLEDAMACESRAAPDAMIMFNCLAAPAVGRALDYLKSKGWSTLVYQTRHMMGVAWRGSIPPVEHTPDPRVDWPVVEHTRGHRVSGVS